MARRRRDSPDPAPTPQPAQTPAPDSSWAEHLAHAAAQARSQVDALSAAQQALATSTAFATQSQTGLAAALANVAAASKRAGAPAAARGPGPGPAAGAPQTPATPPTSPPGSGQPATPSATPARPQKPPGPAPTPTPPQTPPPGPQRPPAPAPQAPPGPQRPPGPAPQTPHPATPAAPPAGLSAAVAQAARSQQALGDAAASAAQKTGTLSRSQAGLAGAVGEASGAMGRLAGGSKGAAEAGGKLAQSAQAVKGQSDKMATAGLAVAGAYAYASSKLLGFVKAGLAGTTAGELLSFNINALHRQIASLFLPVIEGLIKRIQQLTDWFRGLSGEQQQSIARWAGLSVGMLGALTLLPKLITGFGLFGGVLRTAIVANPLLVVTGALVALMSRTEEGRSALKDVGSTLLSAFETVAKLIAGVLIPVVEALTEVLSGPAGKILLWGTIITAVGFKVVAAFAAIKTAALAAGLGISGAFAAATLGVGALIAGVVALLSRSSKLKEFEAEVGEIAKGVRAGRTPQAEAKEQVRQAASGQAYEIQEALKKGGADFWKGLSAAQAAIEKAGVRPPELTFEEQFALQHGGGEGFEEAQRKVVEATQRALEIIGGKKVEEEAKGGKGRSDLVTSRTGQEDPAAVIRRLEESVLKTDVPKQQLDEAKRTNAWLENFMEWLKSKGLNPPIRPDTPPLPPVIPGG